jgi:hypothetical protein
LEEAGISRTEEEEFSPSEFRIAVQMGGLADRERLRLWDALVNRYQESVKYDQRSASSFVSTEGDYDKLESEYDLWDIPDIFRETYKSLNQKLSELIAESIQYQDASYQLSFREIAKDLDIWERTRLQVLEALTYQGRLVRNRDLVAKRIQYRIQELDIRIKQTSQEASQAIKLLEVIERPKALLAGQLSNKEGLPMIDASALDRLVKSDYVGPVVQRVSALQGQVGIMEAEKSRLEKQLSWLPQSADGKVELPRGYKEITTTLYSELNSIIQKYNRLLDEYLKSTITSLVVIKQTPVITWAGFSPVLVLSGIAVLSVLLAILLLVILRLLEKMRE